MITHKHIRVEFLYEDHAYKCYAVYGLENDAEDPSQPYYHEELRSSGSNERYVLSQYVDLEGSVL